MLLIPWLRSWKQTVSRKSAPAQRKMAAVTQVESLEQRLLLTATAVNDLAYTTTEDAVLTINAASGVLANDTGITGTAHAILTNSAGLNGATLTLNDDGSFTLDPTTSAGLQALAAGATANISFMYETLDDTGLSNTALVAIQITGVNDAPTATNLTQTISYTEDALSVPLGDIVTADLDNGAAITATLTLADTSAGSLTTFGTATFAAGVWSITGTAAQVNTALAAVAFVPAANYNQNTSISVDIKDDQNVSAAGTPGTITLVGTAVNDSPIALDDTYTIAEDTALTVAAAGVLGNDTDVDGDSLTAILTAAPTHGSLTLNADGSFTYTPDANFNGTDSFSYQASDGTALSTTAMVNLTITAVNDAPVAVSDSFTTAADTALTVAAAGVLGNDTDVDGDSLTAILTAAPTHGSLTLNADGSFVYTPDTSYNGTDSFSYQASDGTALSNTTTVSLTVTAANSAPVAVNDSFTTAEDAALTVAAAGVLGNDTDADGDSLTTILTAAPTHGSLTLNADGSFVYTPDANYNGTDSFTYQAFDGTAFSNSATVSLTITAANDAPLAVDETYLGTEDATLTVTAPGVLTNDTDAEGDPLTAVLVSDPTHGSLTLNSNGSFTYTPDANFSGTDTFTYQANDGTANGNTATVTLVIAAVNDAPIAVNDAYAVNENASLTTAAPGVISNDTDPDAGDSLTAVLVSGPSHGSLNLNSDGSFTYTPTAEFHGTDTFTYKVNDGALDSGNIATVTITVNPETTISFAGGVLTIGTTAGDSIAVSSDGGGNVVVTVEGVADTSFGSIAASSVTGLVVNGGTGANLIDLTGVTTAAFTSLTSVNVDAGAGDDTVFGSQFNDNFVGNLGNDYLTGAFGDDSLDGSAGNDSILGGAGRDSITGGIGNDTLKGQGGADMIVADDGDDYVDGGVGNDTLNSGAGNDLLLGNDGNDRFVAGAGQDTLSGGLGNDILNGQGGADLIAGDAGDDYIIGGVGNDTLSGGVGNDYMLGDDGDDSISGDDGADSIHAGLGNDSVSGGNGGDYISGNGGNDSLDGGSGADKLAGGNGSDIVRGGTGTDVLEGNAGNDDLDGGAGDGVDTLAGGSGTNNFEVNGGEDVIDESFANNTFGGLLDIV
jgi:VCBS repeat-containing protein